MKVPSFKIHMLHYIIIWTIIEIITKADKEVIMSNITANIPTMFSKSIQKKSKKDKINPI